jgi:hypothetical protein
VDSFCYLGRYGVVAEHAQTHQRTPQGHGGPCRVSRVPLSVRCSHEWPKSRKVLGRPMKIGEIETRCTNEFALSGVIAARLRSFCLVTRAEQKNGSRLADQRAVVYIPPVPLRPGGLFESLRCCHCMSFAKV